jgi:hypothetical protein
MAQFLAARHTTSGRELSIANRGTAAPMGWFTTDFGWVSKE